MNKTLSNKNEIKTKRFFAFFKKKRSRKFHVLGIIFFVILNIAIIIFLASFDISAMKSLGYIGLFISVFFISALAFLPFPMGIIMVSYMFVLNPYLTAVVGGVAAGLGSLGPYFFGYEAKEFLKNNKYYRRFYNFVKPHPKLIIVFLGSFIPNPFFDAITVMSGIFHIGVKRFFLAVAIGKVSFYLMVAFYFIYLKDFLDHYIPLDKLIKGL